MASASALPSKTLHSQDSAPKKCPSNNIVKNIHAVSICELLTVDTIMAVGAGALAAKMVCGGLTGTAHIIVCTLVMSIVIMLWIMAHVWCDMPTNLGYFFGLGKPPHVFKTCACFPKPEAFVGGGDSETATSIGRVKLTCATPGNPADTSLGDSFSFKDGYNV